MFVSVVVGVLMLSACTPGLVQTWEMIGRALCVHGSGSFDRPACNGPDPGPAKWPSLRSQEPECRKMSRSGARTAWRGPLVPIGVHRFCGRARNR